jgi:hypothetical protein
LVSNVQVAAVEPSHRSPLQWRNVQPTGACALSVIEQSLPAPPERGTQVPNALAPITRQSNRTDAGFDGGVVQSGGVGRVGSWLAVTVP